MNKHLEVYLYLLAEAGIGVTVTYLTELDWAWAPVIIAALNVAGKQLVIKLKNGLNNNKKG